MDIPDYIIISKIFPYLTTKEMFLNLRSLSTQFHTMIKNTWGTSIKEEMCSQLKNLSFVYEKDTLTKAYEFKLEYLINYRTLITMYNSHADIPLIIHDLLDRLDDNEIYKLISLFFCILGQEELLLVLYNETQELNEKINILKDKLKSEEIRENYRDKFNVILDISSVESEPQVFRELVNDFNSLNREHIDSFSENSRFIFSFLQGIIEYENLKTNVKDLKKQVETLFTKIQRETQLWPRKKKFFETSYKFLFLAHNSNKRTNFIRKKLEEFKLTNPINEYKEEAYYKMLELKEKMEKKKNEIIELKLRNPSIAISTDEEMKKINDLFLSNLMDRRILLSQKIIVLEKFYDIYRACLKQDEGGKNYFLVGEYNIDKTSVFFFVLSVAYKQKGEKITVKDVSNAYEVYIKNKEESKNKNIIERQRLMIKMKENEKKLETLKEKQIQNLKEQKNNLINQKKKTEQLLGVLKKYLHIKECMLKNKEKYKYILSILRKVKQNDQQSLDLNQIEETINSVDIGEISSETDINSLNESDKEEMQNFEQNDNLLKEIETKLMEQINMCVSNVNEYGNESGDLSKEKDNDAKDENKENN